MNILVIGYGSIGVRHARILSELGSRVSVVSNREINFNSSYLSLNSALENENPEYIVIANKTSEHHKTLLKLIELDFEGIVLIEKPLFSQKETIPEHKFEQVFVAYNLRFHPLLQELYKLLESEKIISVQAYVGQYLPDWRPKMDYRLSYSSSKNEGGGVLRDLSHELDYLNWMLGGWACVASIGGHFSHLEIDSDDVFSLIMKTHKCPIVTLQMNYIDRRARRTILVNTNNHTIFLDLIKNTLTIDENMEKHSFDRNVTYNAMHEAILNKHYVELCSLEEGIEVMNLIYAVEKANDRQVWVEK
jgi:predicted dehydrogenase